MRNKSAYRDDISYSSCITREFHTNPKCKKENPNNASYCEYCGGKLERPSTTSYGSSGGKTIYCKNCGTQNPYFRATCTKCGRVLKETNYYDSFTQNYVNRSYSSKSYGQSKTLAGVLLCMFLGLIGLIIGVCCFPSGSYERKTFTKAWIITFIVEIIIAVILVIILFASASCLLKGRYYY